MLKILQARLQQYVNQELPAVQAGFRIGRGIRDQIANICQNHRKSKGIQKKNIYFWFIDYGNPYDCVDQNKLWIFLIRWEYQTTLPASWETYMQDEQQKLQLDMEQWTGSKLGKEYL